MIVRPGETSEEVIANFGKMRVKRLLRELRTLSLEKFKKYYDGQYEIKEVKPPLDGVAYYSVYEYRHHTMPEFNASVGMQWDKDGNPVGFVLNGKTYLFADADRPNVSIALNSNLAKDMKSPLNTEARIIEPAFGGVAYAVKGRGVTAMRPKGYNGRGVVKSVWFDVIRKYDAHGRYLGAEIIDEDVLASYEIPAEYYQPANPLMLELYAKATYKLVAEKDALGQISGFQSVPVKELTNDNDVVQQKFNNARARVGGRNNRNVPEHSELTKYLEQYPDAILTPDSKWGWITKLPEGSHPEITMPANRIKIWDKDGNFVSVIKGMQAER